MPGISANRHQFF